MRECMSKTCVHYCMNEILQNFDLSVPEIILNSCFELFLLAYFCLKASIAHPSVDMSWIITCFVPLSKSTQLLSFTIDIFLHTQSAHKEPCEGESTELSLTCLQQQTHISHQHFRSCPSTRNIKNTTFTIFFLKKQRKWVLINTRMLTCIRMQHLG